MFNTYNQAKDSFHSHKTTVTENRAPTDESIRIYKEMEDKLINNIMGKASMSHQMCEAKIMVFNRPDLWNTLQYRVLCAVDGNVFEFNDSIDSDFFLGNSKQAMFDTMRDSIAKAVSAYFTGQLVEEYFKVIN